MPSLSPALPEGKGVLNILYKMKKFLKIIIPILVLGLLGFMSYKVITQINHKKQVAEHIKTLPTFAYTSITGEAFTNKSLKENTPTVFVYFNTECEYCQSEAKQIQENKDQFKNVQLVFISFEEPKKITAFANNYKLNHYDNITFLSDTKITFAATFDVKSLPTVVLYDANQKLIAKIKGQTKVATILKHLN
jgi:peroxiredoxin